MDLFGVLHTFVNHANGAYKVIGLFITDGADIPPQLRKLSDFEHYHWKKVWPSRQACGVWQHVFS